MKKIAFLMILLCAPAFAQQSDDSYYPITVGSHWTYSNLSESSGAEITVEVVEIATIGTVNGKEVYAVRETTKFGNVVADITERLIDKQKSMVLNAGTFRKAYDSNWTFSSDTLLLFPLSVGKIWKDNSDGTTESTVIGLTNLKVKAGEFSNVVKVKKATYEKRGQKLKVVPPIEIDYYARNVGLIKTEVFDPKTPQSKVTFELTDYQIY